MASVLLTSPSTWEEAAALFLQHHESLEPNIQICAEVRAGLFLAESEGGDLSLNQHEVTVPESPWEVGL